MEKERRDRIQTLRLRSKEVLAIGALVLTASATHEILNHDGGDCDTIMKRVGSWVGCPVIDTGSTLQQGFRERLEELE